MVASATTPSLGGATGGFGGPGSANGLGTMANGVAVGGAGASGAGGGAVVQQQQDKQALLANEKRKRRRESHNAVERRRRDNINEKISELATLIPECMLDGSGECFFPGEPLFCSLSIIESLIDVAIF